MSLEQIREDAVLRGPKLTGAGGALHDSIDRSHRVLVCALQLLVRVLSSLHRSSRTGAGHVSLNDRTAPRYELTCQALSFLNAHRESLLLILRENQQYLTLQGIEECKLVISVLAMVVHKVPAEDLVSSPITALSPPWSVLICPSARQAGLEVII